MWLNLVYLELAAAEILELAAVTLELAAGALELAAGTLELAVGILESWFAQPLSSVIQ